MTSAQRPRCEVTSSDSGLCPDSMRVLQASSAELISEADYTVYLWATAFDKNNITNIYQTWRQYGFVFTVHTVHHRLQVILNAFLLVSAKLSTQPVCKPIFLLRMCVNESKVL